MSIHRSYNSSSPQINHNSLFSTSIYHPKQQKTSNLIEKMNLKKINEYLEQRINKKVNKNRAQVLNREQQEVKYNYRYENNEREKSRNNFQGDSKERMNKSRLNDLNTCVSPKNMWKKHQSIDKLLQKKYINKEQIRKPLHDAQNHESQQGLYNLERKYQQLQGKYKRLMQQATREARQYQQTKQELNLLKQKRSKNQNILSMLKKQLLELNESSTLNQVQQKQNIIKNKSQPNILAIQSYMQNDKKWNAINEHQKKVRNSSMKNSRINKKSQSWMNSQMQNKKSLQTEQKSLPKPQRYYSATKLTDDKRIGKSIRNSEDYHFANGQSKISLKLNDNLKKSIVRNSTKPVTQTLIRFEGQSSKCITPTNLHKKVINSNLYSKYRFQPTLKIS